MLRDNLNYFRSNYFIGVLFAIYFIIGLLIINDYGISWDEPIEKKTGMINMKYVAQQFHINKIAHAKAYENLPELHSYKDRYYGSWFQLCAEAIEKILGISTFYNTIRLRHYMVFFLFFIGSIYLYRSLLLCCNKLIAIIITLLCITYPRFFAEQFYNTKDIVLLSILSIALFYNIQFLKTRNINTTLLAGITAGLLIATRVIGIILFFEITILVFLDLFHARDNNRENIKFIFLYVFTSTLTTIVFWPYLWESPLQNFIEAFNAMKQFQWDRTVLLNGIEYKVTNLPWYYLPNWIIISTPIIPLLLLIPAIVVLLRKISLSLHKLRHSHVELLNIGLLVLPIFAVMWFRSIVYDGWRHVYFTYLPLCICVGLAIQHFYTYKKRIIYYSASLLLIIQAIINVYQIHLLHPYQNTYFNVLSNANSLKSYDVDYWGLSYNEGLKHILKTDKRKKINIHLIGSQENTRYFSFPQDRIMNFVELKEADYFLTNYRWHPNEYPEYKEVYSIKRGDTKIMSVFKLK